MANGIFIARWIARNRPPEELLKILVLHLREELPVAILGPVHMEKVSPAFSRFTGKIAQPLTFHMRKVSAASRDKEQWRFVSGAPSTWFQGRQWRPWERGWGTIGVTIVTINKRNVFIWEIFPQLGGIPVEFKRDLG